MSTRATYTDHGVAKLEQFFDSVFSEAKGGAETNVLDSASVKGSTQSVLTAAKGGDVQIPAALERVLAITPEKDQARVLDSVVYGMEIYRKEHGVLPTADVLDAALQQGMVAGYEIDGKGRLVDASGRALDSVGSTGHHDQISAQPNRIVVAITSAIAEAIPFGTYLPTDIGSNEARLGIVQHQAGSAFGGYALSELMDGVNIGKEYLSAERRITLTLAGDELSATGQFLSNGASGTGLPVLRGRTIVFVNGYPCAYENPNTAATAANSPISGSINLAGTDYTVGGSVTVATGAVALNFSPALPENTRVEAEGFIDYEANTALTPSVVTQVSTFSLYATPWRATADQTVDSKTQYANELGLDLQSESLMAIRNQFSMERHYAALNKLMALALNRSTSFDFKWTTQGVEKTRAEIWMDFYAHLCIVDQTMAEDTMDHGISHIYVGKNGLQLANAPSFVFEPSGLQARPGIYRLGRLFGRWEVYYTPKKLTETSTATQMLCIGRSQQVARCPVVLGDAVAPTYLPLAMDKSMKYQNGFYARNFTSVNPHVPSAKGAALINVTNLF